jgi:hypothetical protein
MSIDTGSTNFIIPSSLCCSKAALTLKLYHRAQTTDLSTERYKVDRAIPKRDAISATGISAFLRRPRIVLISLTESLEGRPPVLPRARAALSPAIVRSRMRLRSNSARAANTWKTSRPAGETVSIFRANWRPWNRSANRSRSNPRTGGADAFPYWSSTTS